MAWWVISDEGIMDMLHQVEAGESPDMVWLEHMANATPPPEAESDE